ncbi:NUDIX hydrolase [Patescibacteria group bacterium]|nr:NUDIX hydrolase [Patescibacteria group bacterium]MBU1501141.1 NUDIX hydrolase [Patescibacteria group bacterium]MBU2080986.1 NUDIX hydrolase [Patescibacteria group bacterium]MBU2124078.1 NUDIX hydrolase [Patescibacteria group bacterium]MBU2194933.1 NUDIX hydrolase [Patescibacteria group bacterium]
MNLQVGVKVLLRNKQREFLVLKRSQEKYPTVNNLWDIPGGRIDPGVSLEENLKREVLEETGLALTSDPKLCAAQDILKKEIHVVRITYTAHAEGKVCLSDEHTEYKWISIENLRSLDLLDRYVRELVHTEELIEKL